MRILQVHTRYRQAGGEDAVAEQEGALLERAGHEVVRHWVDNPAHPAGAALHLAAAPWNPRAARRLARVARQVRPDVAHVHNTWFAQTPSVLAALHRADVPVVMTLHNYRLLCANAQLYRDGAPCERCVGTSPWHGVRFACYRGSRAQSVPAAASIALHHRRGTWQRDVDVFLALTDFARDRFVAGGLPADRITVKPNAVPDPGPRQRPPSASDTVLAVGRLSPEKGFATLIGAFNALGSGGLRLLVVGDGPERPTLERLAGPAVTFAGRLSAADVRHHMLQARALAFPSQWYETFGLAMVEAMAAGLPVVASALGGTPQVLGGGGWLVTAGAARDWADALRRLQDDAAVDTVGAAGREEWARRFSPEIVVPILEEAYAHARALRGASGRGATTREL